jgi:carbon starvation protein
MLLEGLVGVVALIAASTLPPQDYFAINTDLSKAVTPEVQASIATVTHGEHDDLPALEAAVEEQLRGRSGGAVSLAVGISNVLAPEGGPLRRFVKYWYHFAIMFEALFILTTIDTGTRIARFLLQEAFGRLAPSLGQESSLPGALLSTGLVVLGWGYFIWTSSIDTIWPMFGIANQLLAVVALATVTSWLVNEGRARFAWVTLAPMLFVTTTTSCAGWELVTVRFRALAASADPAVSFRGWLNIVLTVAMLACVLVILGASALRWTRGRPRPA